MKRSKSQLNAIQRSYQVKEEAKLQEILTQHKLSDEFRQSKYTSVRWFLKSKGLV
jgi:hypothetical protein